MKLTGFILLLSMACSTSSAQYFLTGEVRDPHGDKLQNVSILIQSTGAKCRTGVAGDFRITSNIQEDSLSFVFDGYQPYTTLVSATGFLQVTLKRLPFTTGFRNNHLASYISRGSMSTRTASSGLTAPYPGSPDHTGPSADPSPGGLAGSSSSANTAHTSVGTASPFSGTPVPPSGGSLVENPFVSQTASISYRAGIDHASYSYIRKFLDMGLPVPPDAVKIEEMLNYFNAYYEEPEKKEWFHCQSNLLPCPWNTTHKLLCLNVCARKADWDKAPASNLVFLVDASGSMDMPNKMPLVKSGFRSLVRNLRDKDLVSIVQYGGRIGVTLEGVAGSQEEKITRAIEELEPDGPTPGETGIRLAYEVAQRQFIQGGNNRIILVTDGDINEGVSSEKELEDFIEEKNQAGIHLTCVGIGMDSTQNSGLAELAKKGQGNFAYVGEEEELGKLLVGELILTASPAPAAFTVADHVSITTEFDSALVKEYRLIGFDNKKGAPEDSSSRLVGSCIGSGHSILALFEIVSKEDSTGADTLARVKVSYCLPGETTSRIMSYACLDDPALHPAPGNASQHTGFGKAADRARFKGAGAPATGDPAETNGQKVACIALFGMKLKGSGYASTISWSDMEKMAKKTFTGNDLMDRQYIALVTRARKIYEHRSSR